MLLQFTHLSPTDQYNIIQCNLAMKMALQRCESVYLHGNCEAIRWGDIVGKYSDGVPGIKDNAILPYASRKCPFGFKRNGCCKCEKLCNPTFSSPETLGDKDIHNYC